MPKDFSKLYQIILTMLTNFSSFFPTTSSNLPYHHIVICFNKQMEINTNTAHKIYSLWKKKIITADIFWNKEKMIKLTRPKAKYEPDPCRFFRILIINYATSNPRKVTFVTLITKQNTMHLWQFSNEKNIKFVI